MHYLLFTTTSCPKCPSIKDFVKDHCPFSGILVDNTSSDFMQLIATYQVSEAPTFLVLDEKDTELFRGSEIYELESFFTH